MSRRKIVFLILAIAWMMLIFCFSSREGDTSTEDSNHIGMLIGEYFVPGFEGWDETEQLVFAQRIDHPIRKTAHALEYAVLGVLIFGIFEDKKHKMRYNGLVAWGLGTIYAASDEFHQLFVVGRSGQVSDVLLDSTGVAAGILIVGWILWLVRRRKSNQKE